MKNWTLCVLLAFSTQVSALELTRLEAISTSKRTFITRNGKAQGHYEGSIASFSTDDLSFTARAIVSTREYSQWLVLRPYLQVPLKPGTVMSITKGREHVELLNPEFSVDEEYHDQQKLFALNSSHHLVEKAFNIERINELMAQMNAEEASYFDPRRPGHPYQVLGVPDKSDPLPEEEAEIIVLNDKDLESSELEELEPQQEIITKEEVESVQEDIEKLGLGSSAEEILVAEIPQQKSQIIPLAIRSKSTFSTKMGITQSQSITVQGVPNLSFSSSGNKYEFEYQYQVMARLRVGIGFRQESERVSSTDLDLVSTRSSVLASLSYADEFSKDWEFYTSFYAGGGSSSSENSEVTQSGSFYLLPGIRLGIAHYLTQKTAIIIEGAAESLRIVEQLPSTEDGTQSTNQVNLHMTAGLQFGF